jgi:hypothetical protein
VKTITLQNGVNLGDETSTQTNTVTRPQRQNGLRSGHTKQRQYHEVADRAEW